ncbi:MAG: alpha-L-fucosidase [Gemmatimonadaceae bacterium]
MNENGYTRGRTYTNKTIALLTDGIPNIRAAGGNTAPEMNGGNDSLNGSGGETNWSMVNPAVVTYPGIDGPGITKSLQNGDADGSVWRPAEADTSIRPGWFYHPADDAKVRTVDNLYDLYFKSVGRNAKLLLNVPPTRAGLLHDTDVARLTQFRERLAKLNESKIVRGAKSSWHATTGKLGESLLEFNTPQTISAFRLSEDIAKGQSVARWSVQVMENNDWRVVARGTTIGYARMEHFDPLVARQVKLVIEEVVDETPSVRPLIVYG